jgi:hypothetical protein
LLSFWCVHSAERGQADLLVAAKIWQTGRRFRQNDGMGAQVLILLSCGYLYVIACRHARTTMKKRGVEELDGCTYKHITPKGLVIQRKEKEQLLEVDTVVVCAGQEPLRELFNTFKEDVRASLFVDVVV